MSNITELDTESAQYTTSDDGICGVVSRPGMTYFRAKGGDIAIDSGGPFPSRKEAAEFLWMCAHLIDPEQRFQKNEYPGLNYE